MQHKLKHRIYSSISLFCYWKWHVEKRNVSFNNKFKGIEWVDMPNNNYKYEHWTSTSNYFHMKEHIIRAFGNLSISNLLIPKFFKSFVASRCFMHKIWSFNKLFLHQWKQIGSKTSNRCIHINQSCDLHPLTFVLLN